MLHVDFTPAIHALEGNAVLWFAEHWVPALVYFFVIIYIGVYPFTLWFSPLYFFASDEKKAMKTIAYGLLLIYLIVLPFYLFFPVTNVYTYSHIGSSLEHVIPSVERFFYATTTTNNSFPSLHVAVSLLIARSASLTKNKRYRYFTYFTAGAVLFSVMYLAIHWITDVIGGVIIAAGVFIILNRFFIKEKHDILNHRTTSSEKNLSK
jgi:membrane-associated phospholipid phosphatase